VDELTVRSLGLLYELLVVAQQGSWCDEPNSFFTVNWTVEAIQQLNPTDLVTLRLSVTCLRVHRARTHTRMNSHELIRVIRTNTKTAEMAWCKLHWHEFIRGIRVLLVRINHSIRTN